MTLMGTNVLAVLDLTGRLPPQRKGGGSQLCSFIRSTLLGQALCCSQSQQLQTQRWGSSCHPEIYLSMLPPHRSTPLLRTGCLLPAPHPTKLELPLKNLVLHELRRDGGETSHRKVGRGSSITQKELKIIQRALGSFLLPLHH